MRFLKILSIIIIFSLISSCHYSGEPEFTYQYIPPQQIDDGWETTALSSVNLDPESVSQIIHI